MKHRNFDGHIVSMKQSGAHWLQNILSEVLIQIYDLPPLEHIQDDSIIGHTKSKPVYAQIPQIVHSHGFPHALTHRVPFLHYPKYLVLLRDLQTSLVSHYERFKGDYNNIPFSEYLRGDVRQKKYHSDIYSRIRFMNEWGDVMSRNKGVVSVLKYENMLNGSITPIRKVCSFFQIEGATDKIIKIAIERNTKEKMADKPKNPKIDTTVVRTKGKPVADYFAEEDTLFFNQTCENFLKYDFGYDYQTIEP